MLKRLDNRFLTYTSNFLVKFPGRPTYIPRIQTAVYQKYITEVKFRFFDQPFFKNERIFFPPNF